MALDKLVDSTQLDADLTTIANAIRTKGGTSEQLSFPSGMAQAVADLPSGGGNLLHESGLVDSYGDISTYLDIPVSDTTKAHYYVEAKLTGIWYKENGVWTVTDGVDLQTAGVTNTSIPFGTSFIYPKVSTGKITLSDGTVKPSASYNTGVTLGIASGSSISALAFTGGITVSDGRIRSTQRKSVQDSRVPYGTRFSYDVWGWD